MPNPIWQKRDVGCHIDGGFGLDHQRAATSFLVRKTMSFANDVPSYGLRGCLAALDRPMSDDDSETYEATAYLQSHTADGLIWQWLDGDLILMNKSEVE